MAIKTKKISDLGKIDLNMYTNILGCTSGETGKIDYSTLESFVSQIVSNNVVNGGDDEINKIKDEIIDIKTEINKIKSDIAILQELNKDFNDKFVGLQNQIDEYHSQSEQATYAMQTSVHQNAVNNEKTVGFIKELQKDRYLTLAEIKKAASNAFPVSTTEESAE